MKKIITKKDIEMIKNSDVGTATLAKTIGCSESTIRRYKNSGIWYKNKMKVKKEVKE